MSAPSVPFHIFAELYKDATKEPRGFLYSHGGHRLPLHLPPLRCLGVTVDSRGQAGTLQSLATLPAFLVPPIEVLTLRRTRPQPCDPLLAAIRRLPRLRSLTAAVGRYAGGAYDTDTAVLPCLEGLEMHAWCHNGLRWLLGRLETPALREMVVVCHESVLDVSSIRDLLRPLRREIVHYAQNRVRNPSRAPLMGGFSSAGGSVRHPPGCALPLGSSIMTLLWA